MSGPDLDERGLETRALGDRPEVLCPSCGQWRPGFCVVPRPDPGDGPAFWCDADVAVSARAAEAEARTHDLDRIKAELRADVDRAAGNLRRQFITDIPGQQAVYLEKAREAAAWLAASAADPADFPYLAAEAHATLGTAAPEHITARAQLVSGAAAAVLRADALLEAARVAAKEAIAAADTVAAAQAAAAIEWPALTGGDTPAGG